MNINVSNIPNRLKNPSKEHPYVAGAVDLYDDTLGKPQSQVNQERIEDIAEETQRAQAEENLLQGEINALSRQNYVTVGSYSGLPDLGAVDTIYRVSNWDGTQVDATKYAEYAWNNTGIDQGEYVLLDVKTQVGEVFDISLYKAVGGVLAKFADLSAALDGGNNVPAGVRQGGMSIKFVQSSDNKYIQYRLTADEFTTDTTQWAIADEGVYVENPEFVYVKTDSEGKILWAIKVDGSIYYGAGVPQQVVDYINEKIAELSLDEYEDIVAFLNDLEKGDKTLQTLLDEKVDKEEGKSLIPTQYIQEVENPEYIEAKTDSEDKILEATEKDGTKLFGGDVKVLGSIDVSGVTYKVVSNPEWLEVVLDSEDRIICGIRTDGTFCIVHLKFLDSTDEIKDKLSFFDTVDSPEFISVEVDADDKILGGRKIDGTKFENVGFETPEVSIGGHVEKNIEDPEGRSEITTDSEDKIISYRDADGVKHECGGLNTPSINGVSVDNLGISNNSNLSPREYNLPKYGYVDIQKELSFTDGTNSYLPKKISKVNDKYYVTASLVDGQVVPESIEVTLVESDIDTTQWPEDTKTKHYCKVAIDFGSYLSGTFYIEVKFQGSSSIAYPKKNFRFTFYNTLLFSKKVKIKIGELIKTSKYNIKAYWIDRCVVREPACYRIIQAINESQEYSEQYPWNSYYNIPTGATGLAMNFPIRIDVSGSFYGIEWFGLAKDISNFMLDDKTMNGILIQGVANDDPNFWKVLTPTEWDDILADEDNTIGEDSLQYVQNFFNYINSNSFSRESAAEHMNIEKWIDCIIIFEVFNSVDSLNKNFMLYAGPDKTIFYPMYYDFDYTFNGNSEQSVLINGIGMDKSIFYNFRKLFWDDICKRYKQLRKNILTTEFIISTIQNSLRSVEYQDYILEMSKWDEHGIGSVAEYSGWIDRRLKWLDSHYNL